MCRSAKGRAQSKAFQTEAAAYAKGQIHGVVRELQGDYGDSRKGEVGWKRDFSLNRETGAQCHANKYRHAFKGIWECFKDQAII